MDNDKTKAQIERVGAGGEVGKDQAGTPLHKPQGRRDRELGERERVGAGGPIGDGGNAEDDKKHREAAIGQATQQLVEEEIEHGDAAPSIEPDQKNEAGD